MSRIAFQKERAGRSRFNPRKRKRKKPKPRGSESPPKRPRGGGGQEKSLLNPRGREAKTSTSTTTTTTTTRVPRRSPEAPESRLTAELPATNDLREEEELVELVLDVMARRERRQFAVDAALGGREETGGSLATDRPREGGRTRKQEGRGGGRGVAAAAAAVAAADPKVARLFVEVEQELLGAVR